MFMFGTAVIAIYKTRDILKHVPLETNLPAVIAMWMILLKPIHSEGRIRSTSPGPLWASKCFGLNSLVVPIWLA